VSGCRGNPEDEVSRDLQGSCSQRRRNRRLRSRERDIQCAGVSVLPGDSIVIDGNGVVVVPMEEAAAILQRAQRLLETERLLQEKIKAGATIGELVNVDQVFRTAFSYQNKALEHG